MSKIMPSPVLWLVLYCLLIYFMSTQPVFLSRESSELKKMLNIGYKRHFLVFFKLEYLKLHEKKEIFCQPALRSLNQGVGTTVGTRWPAMRKRKPQGTF